MGSPLDKMTGQVPRGLAHYLHCNIVPFQANPSAQNYFGNRARWNFATDVPKTYSPWHSWHFRAVIHILIVFVQIVKVGHPRITIIFACKVGEWGGLFVAGVEGSTYQAISPACPCLLYHLPIHAEGSPTCIHCNQHMLTPQSYIRMHRPKHRSKPPMNAIVWSMTHIFSC